MSSSEEEEKVIEPMPPHKIRFTDFPEKNLCEKVIRMVDKINEGQKYDKDVAIDISRAIQ